MSNYCVSSASLKKQNKQKLKMKNWNLRCSPVTFKKLQNDEDYRNEVIKQLMDSRPPEEINIVPTIIVSEIATEHATEDGSSGDNANKDICSKKANKVLTGKCQVRPTIGFTINKSVGSNYQATGNKYQLAMPQDSNTGNMKSEMNANGQNEEGCSKVVLQSNTFVEESELSKRTTIPGQSNRRSRKRKKRSDATYSKILQTLTDKCKKSGELHKRILERLEKREKFERERNEALKKIVDSLNQDIFD